ncbi:uncharacterized protein [Nicotiana tomentosiformis]|uniref:uncharacterized protein n=1 Tax=Nicotiana tomentosiformis TaxID=4098 RepID=UPI00388C4119
MSDECEESYRKLRVSLTMTQVFVPTSSKPYIVYCDALCIGHSAVLMQGGSIIAYVYRQLKSHEKNYPMHDLVVAAIANVVVDALSKKAESMDSLAFIPSMEMPLAMDVQALAKRFVRLDILEPSRVLDCIGAQSYLLERIKAFQFNDPHLLLLLKDTVQQGGAKKVMIGGDGVMRLHGCICVLNVYGLRDLTLEEAQRLRYFVHPGITKMYRELKHHYWWWKMNKDIVEHVSWCLNCQ